MTDFEPHRSPADAPGESVHAKPSSSAESIRVCADPPCVRCGYNLRTLSVDGCCPECGLSVLRTLVGDMIVHSDPKWIERLARGAELNIISLCLAVFFLPLCAAAFNSIDRYATHVIVHLVAVSGPLLLVMLSAYGTWLISASEKRSDSLNHGEWLRWILRMSAVAGVGVGAVLAVSVSLWLSHFSLLFMALLIAAVVFLLLASFLQSIYLSRLAPRTNDHDMKKMAQINKWVYFIFCLLVGLIVLTQLAGGPSVLLMSFSCMLLFCFVGLYFWTISMSVLFSDVLKKTAQKAREYQSS